MIRIVAIADTHMSHEELDIPNGDILVVAGDFCGYGTPEEAISFNAWLGRQPCTHKVVVPGNHDLFCAKDGVMYAKNILSNATYLDMERATIMGLNFYGVPWTPQFGDWAYMYARNSNRGAAIWSSVPDDTHILISHGPAARTGLGIVRTHSGQIREDAGCEQLRLKIDRLAQLKHHFCGHIHQNFGMAAVGNAQCHNVCVVDETYSVVNKPTVVDIKES